MSKCRQCGQALDAEKTISAAALAIARQNRTEVAWLLERGGNDGKPIEYISANLGVFEWTTDSLKALRLSRRADGDALASVIEDAERVVEHMWCKP